MAKSKDGKGENEKAVKVPVKKIIRLSPDEILVRKARIALKNGTLRRTCEESYGAKYVQKNFCPECQYREACKMMKGIENGNSEKSETD